ncbi:MAG: hypothetical protein FWH18_01230 [Marinilabiliaceae bacterium]|nr:hypothetical protein [Marinilabiliaceae bacterium]
MPFIKDLLRHKSVSIVGMAKNTGKTTCLNFVINRLKQEKINFAVTSIGVDGEEKDILYQTPKPRIELSENMIFVTSENDFANINFPAEILSISERSTPLGKLITAKAKGNGIAVLSGPSDSIWLQQIISEMQKYNIQLTLVDGALSRMSLASPAVTDAMILCTGAACSAQLQELINKTKFRCKLIDLEQVDINLQKILITIEDGVWIWNDKHDTRQKICDSLFTFDKETIKLPDNLSNIYVSGAVTNNFLKLISTKKYKNIQIIVRDFTKLFIETITYNKFLKQGSSVKVIQKPKLLAVCTNPVSPEGVRLNPIILQEQMQEALQLPVYDILANNYQ